MRYDAVIIGSGAGGAPLALRFATAGMKTLVLEKGPDHQLADYEHDELALEEGLFTPSPGDDPHAVVTPKTTTPILSTLGWGASCVGGGTAHMGSYLFRFHPADFRMGSLFGDAARNGLESAEANLVDWPFSYDALEPYYAAAEREIGVAGRAGANPFEGPRSAPYPMPPLKAHPIAARLEGACAKRGLTAFPTPRGVNSIPRQGRPACAYCECCAGYGCPTGARGSTQAALLPRAEATGNCDVLAGAMVHTITVDRRGRASGCVFWDVDGMEREVAADVVCVACSAVESARLLLMSASSRFPDGLANNNGLVGRNLQFHAVTMGYGEFSLDSAAGEILRDPHPFLGRSVMDYYFLPDGVAELPKGGLLRFGFMPRAPIAIGRRALAESPGDLWGESLKQAIRRRYAEQRSVSFEAFHDFLPNERTAVELDPAIKDKWGLPAARIKLDLHPHHRICGEWLAARAGELLDDLGAETISITDIGGTSSYLVMGTCRAGDDPDASVLDANCQAHEVGNLYVVDGSFMPTSGGGPPTLTILANSFRVADRIVDGFR